MASHSNDASGPRTVVVATCGNPRKYNQSFTALWRVAAEHNARLESKLEQGEPLWQTMSGQNPHKRVPDVFFRFLALHYDTNKERMFLSTSQVVPPTVTVLTNGRDEEEEVRDELDVHVDVVIHKVASFGTRRAAAAMDAWAAAQRERYSSRLPIVLDSVAEVDVLNSRTALYDLLDKIPGTCVSRTFLWSPPESSAVPDRVTAVGDQSALPLAEDTSEGGTAPQRLANGFPGAQWWIIKPDEGSGPAFTHHLVMWCTGNPPKVSTPEEEEEKQDEQNNNKNKKTNDNDNDNDGQTEDGVSSAVRKAFVPIAVRDALPTAAEPRFIVQEMYTSALPIVLKVYCIGPHVFVKVSPTVKMLTMLRDGITGLDVPVFMDSQDKELFTSTGLPTAASSQPPSSRHVCSLPVSGDYSANGQLASERPSVSRRQSVTKHPLVIPTSSSSPPTTVVETMAAPADASMPSDQLDLAACGSTGPASTLAYGVSGTSFESVVPNDFWTAWLAPGTPARKRVESIAASLRSNLSLGLFGFDILLVPAHLAHPYQRERCPVGFGEEEPAVGESPVAVVAATPATLVTEDSGAVSVDSVDAMMREAKIRSSVETAHVPLSPTEMMGNLWGPDAMFDLATAEPTELLTQSIPCVIDVNYFPGYKGWDEANDNMLALISQQINAEEVLQSATPDHQ